jgi:3-hydroxyacyl-CoA dehydrogenase/enoyl-CoA hydratase/3-hydroxybutyryl-CoA epimerase
MFEGLRLVHWKTDLRNDGVLVLEPGPGRRKGERALARGHRRALRRCSSGIVLETPKGVVVRSGKPAGIPAPTSRASRRSRPRARPRTGSGSASWSSSAWPSCAARPWPIIHGLCLGGGTELALACRYRVASDDASTRIGLPEVKLGIYPGWGGSVRLPRLVGAPAAMDVMLTGRNLSASAAKAIGLVDRVVDSRS